jgi:predicted nucleic acid-binding protein
MAGLYLDTSALGRVLLAEPDAAAIRATLASYAAWWSSGLLIVELRRLAARAGLHATAEGMLRGVRTVPVDGTALERSSRLLPLQVRSLDAIHLDAALQLRGAGDVAAVLTFDHQLQAGCAHHGLSVEAPAAA